MALFDWLSPKKKAKPEPTPESSGLSRMESTRPVNTRRAHGTPAEPPPGQPANRKHERIARREMLYGVVRECMANAGVISAAYKFKVLSLDARGRQFLVMVDLSREFASDTVRLAEVEAMVAQAAKVRFDIVVTAVYWRTNEHVAVGLHTAGGRPTALVTPSRPMPLDSRPQPLESTVLPKARKAEPEPEPLIPDLVISQPAPLSPAGGRFEPLHEEEVAAFKKALASGVSGKEAMAAAQPPGQQAARSFDGAPKHGPQSYTLLTGFEDTEMPDQETRSPALSATQYGDLR